MEAAASLKQTVTYLFDAVRYSIQAKDLQKSAHKLEEELEGKVKTLKEKFDQMAALLAVLKEEQEEVLSDVSKQLTEFATTAVEQATGKLQRLTKEEVAEETDASARERAKAVKSLEGFLASAPLPVVERSVRVESEDGAYSAQALYNCDGDIQYSFALATQNSKLFAKELVGSLLGVDLKVPVKFARAMLRKDRTPGFERLDRYLLDSAELSGDRIHAKFRRGEEEAEIRVDYSNSSGREFLAIEYQDKAGIVNVVNDPALRAHVDASSIQAAMGKLMAEVGELEVNKVALTGLSSAGEEVLESLDCYGFLQDVLKVMGGKYRGVLRQLGDAGQSEGGEDGVTLEFVRERLKLLGDVAKPVTQSLGLNGRS